MAAHEHIKAFLMYEIDKTLSELQRRGIGYIDGEGTCVIDYRIDDTTYEISIREKEVLDDGTWKMRLRTLQV